MAQSRLKVKLNEVPNDGDSWQFDQNSKDALSDYLAPEVDISNYHIDVQIRPVGNIFEVQVSYRVSHDLLCSKCAYEFKLPVEKTCREILMVSQKNARIDKQKSTSKNWSDDMFCTELDSSTLNLGEFLREVILIEAPNRPLGFGQLCEDEACEPIKTNAFTSSNSSQWPSEQKNQPFSVLKDVKIGKKPIKQ